MTIPRKPASEQASPRSWRHFRPPAEARSRRGVSLELWNLCTSRTATPFGVASLVRFLPIRLLSLGKNRLQWRDETLADSSLQHIAVGVSRHCGVVDLAVTLREGKVISGAGLLFRICLAISGPILFESPTSSRIKTGFDSLEVRWGFSNQHSD